MTWQEILFVVAFPWVIVGIGYLCGRLHRKLAS